MGTETLTGKTPIEGGCLCGRIRYRSTAAPMGAGYCHCSVCRKAYGHLYAAFLRFEREHFRFTGGEPAYYRESDIATRGFCQDCGSSLLFSYDNQPNLFVLAGSLDRPQDWPFDDSAGSWGHTFVDDKLPWLEINDGLPQHAQTAGFLVEAQTRHAEKDR